MTLSRLPRLSLALILVAICTGWLAGSLSAIGAQEAERQWSSAKRGDLTLWHSQGQERADDLADHAQGAYDLVSELIDTATPAPLTIIVWPSGADPSDPEQLPDGVAAEISPVHVLRSTSGDVRSAVTNALINAATGQNAAEVPVWMRTGLGLWSQGPLPGFFLRRAGSVLFLDYEEFYTTEQLEVVPTTWQFQAKYFGQVGGMIAWFLQDWGPESLADLFHSVGEGASFYDAVEEIYGIPEDELISEFTNNAERALLLNWPFIERQDKPFYEQFNLNHIMMIAAAIPVALLLFFIAKRSFYD